MCNFKYFRASAQCVGRNCALAEGSIKSEATSTFLFKTLAFCEGLFLSMPLLRSKVPATEGSSVYNLRFEWDSAGHPLRHQERLGEVSGGGCPGLAHTHGGPLHHGGGPIRSQDPRKVLPRKTRHLGKLQPGSFETVC